MLNVEFHCHTRYSKDSLTEPEALLAACRQRQIDHVIVTDHNTIVGALAARRLDPERVIVGEEIMTTHGELLAAYVQEEIPPGLAPEEAICRLRAQAAFISVSHPFDLLRSGHWEIQHLQAILPLVDAIETFNARSMWPGANRRAQAFASRHNIPGTAGSDAHTAGEIGGTYLRLPEFSDAAGLRAVIRQAQPHTAGAPPWVHLYSRQAARAKRS